MAVNAGTVWEIRSTATAGNVNGGGFDPSLGGVDRSQQDAPFHAYTDLASSNGNNASPQVTSVARPFVAGDVGNVIKINAGTNWTVGWFMILSVAGGAATLDRAVGSAASLASGEGNLGGAISLGTAGTSSSDDSFFEMGVGGNKYWIKTGTYVGLINIIIAASGGTQKPIVIEGYDSTRGDSPTGNNRPTLDRAAFAFTLGTNWDIYNVIFTGTTSTQVLACGQNSKVVNCKVVNNSGSAGRFGILMAVDAMILNCEVESTLGGAIRITTAVHCTIIGCYIHDSDIGFSITATTTSSHIAYNIFDNCATQGIFINAANTATHTIIGNTFYGTEAKQGIAVQMISGVTDVRLINNIFYGFVTAISHADVQTVGYDNFNNYFNNTADVSNWVKGPNSIALDPEFVNASAGDFRIGTNLRAAGIPSAFPGEITTGYTDIGAVQRKESISNLPGGASVVKAGVDFTLNDAELTGTYDGADLNSSPDESDVRFGVTWKDGSPTDNRMGTLDLPAEEDVRALVDYDGGVQSGLLDVPTESEVAVGVTFDDGVRTGTYNAAERWSTPTPSDLRDGVQLKNNSLTENVTGTLVVPSLENTKIGVNGDGGVGTYDGSDRHTHPLASELKSGVQVKNNSLTNNLTGTYKGEDFNTNPGAQNVASGIGYQILGSSFTGTLSQGAGEQDPVGLIKLKALKRQHVLRSRIDGPISEQQVILKATKNNPVIK